MTDKQLAACPLCGCYGIAMTSVESNPMCHSIKCEDCPCGANFYSSTRDQAIAAWNRRAAPAAPTEGARDASAQQDEREALYQAIHAALMGHGMSYTEDTGSGEKFPLVDKLCAPGDKTIKTGKDEIAILAEVIVDAIPTASATQQEQADAAVGTAVAWRWKTQIPDEIGGGFAWSFGSHWSTGPRDRQEPLYAHPDPLLAECVEALEEIKENCEILLHTDSRTYELACSVLAKVQAAKEGKS